MTDIRWLRVVAVGVAALLVAFLLAAEVGVAYRATKPPDGFDQSRLHWNTKNSTRFAGNDLTAVSRLVSQAVYPSTSPETTPDVVILFDTNDWLGGLRAASLLRPLNAVLLPTSGDTGTDLSRLHPNGNAAVSAQVLLVNDVPEPGAGYSTRRISSDDVTSLLVDVGAPPRNAVVVDPNDPGSALLAAPWAAFSGDIVITDEQSAPLGLPMYALGEAQVSRGVRINGGTAAETSVAFASYEDPTNPFFGWGFNGKSLGGYRAYTLARQDDPAMALMSANLARRGKPGPLLWTDETQLPQVVNNYLWSQRAAFYSVPNEGPFHHFWILGDVSAVSFPAQAQADYAVEIGPYRMKGPGLSGLDMLASLWVALGAASAVWVAVHAAKAFPHQGWLMRLAWPLLAFMIGPFGIPLYAIATRSPLLQDSPMTVWDRPLWLQALVATVSSVGIGGLLMVSTSFFMTMLGLPLIPSEGPLFWLGSPMVLVMIASYSVAVLVAWLLFQTPMLSMFFDRGYLRMLPVALPIVAGSMAAVSLAMFPGMWWLMMWNLPMMPSEESILWFGVMFFTVFLGLLMAWPFNYLFVRRQFKSGMM